MDHRVNAKHEPLQAQLLNMMEEDERVRAELAADQSLFCGYHPRMQEVHVRNAAALEAIIREHRWPTEQVVGQQGAEAA